jgi:hypothetical protein
MRAAGQAISREVMLTVVPHREGCTLQWTAVGGVQREFVKLSPEAIFEAVAGGVEDQVVPQNRAGPWL